MSQSVNRKIENFEILKMTKRDLELKHIDDRRLLREEINNKRA